MYELDDVLCKLYLDADLPIKRIKFDKIYMESILSGKKTCTTRIEQKACTGDNVYFEGDNDCFHMLYVNNVIRMRWVHAKWDRDLYRLEGFGTKDEYIYAVKKIYPELTDNDFVYIHHFKYKGSRY